MKVRILQHDGGELGNQLWNYASVYAYALERGYACENLSFFEYAQYFQDSKDDGLLFHFLSLPFRNYHRRRNALRRRFFRKLYKALIVVPAAFLWRKRNIYSRNTTAPDLRYDLPPTAPPTPELARLEKEGKPFFFSCVSGGFFRNPKGLERHGEGVRARFAPARAVEKERQAILEPLRRKYRMLVGVHIRQGDYKTFKGGKYWVEQARIREVLDEFLAQRALDAGDVCFVIASDGAIDTARFSGLHYRVSDANAGTDLFLLAGCDAIIGSNSTFGYFAAYLGDIPHLVLMHEAMDWAYYADRTRFFENKYLSVMTY